jgi:hypothetical protein
MELLGTLSRKLAYPQRGENMLQKIAVTFSKVRLISRLATGTAALSLLAFAASPSLAHAQDGVGATASTKATAKDVGLPVYPGAKPHKDKDNDSDALNVGLWGNTFGFKMALMKLESTDSPEKVAAFYAKALAKYGKVLNCSDPAQAKSAKDKGDSSKELTCDDDGKTEKGEVVFKAGTKDNRHIVSVKPNGSGSVFDLVFLNTRGTDEKKPAS